MKQIKIIIENGLIRAVLAENGESVAAEVIDLDLSDSEYHDDRLPAYAAWLQNNPALQQADIADAFYPDPILPKYQFEANLSGLYVIHCSNVTNPWIDFLVACRPDDLSRAESAIYRGLDEFWKDDDLCYGDAVINALQKDGIFFYLCFADLTEDEQDTTDAWNDWVAQTLQHYNGSDIDPDEIPL